MYSKEDRKKAVELWLKYDKCATAVTNELGYPCTKMLKSWYTDLWEVRTILPNKISRVFFTVWKGFMVLLHSIIKKSKKTPKEDLDLAKKRRNEVLKGGVSDEK